MFYFTHLNLERSRQTPNMGFHVDEIATHHIPYKHAQHMQNTTICYSRQQEKKSTRAKMSVFSARLFPTYW